MHSERREVVFEERLGQRSMNGASAKAGRMASASMTTRSIAKQLTFNRDAERFRNDLMSVEVAVARQAIPIIL